MTFLKHDLVLASPPKNVRMKKILPISFIIFNMMACNQQTSVPVRQSNAALNKMFDDYYEERLKLFPLEATQNGDSRYNDLLPINITQAYRDTLRNFYSRYLQAVEKYDTAKLDDNDLISYKIFDREMKMQIESLDLGMADPPSMSFFYIPFQQFWGLPITMGQLGSGEGVQPFKTEKDYSDWLSRMQKFATWSDSAIVQFKNGIKSGFVLPKDLVIKMIPQMEALTTTDTSANIFYGPVKKFPAAFPDSLRSKIFHKYANAINAYII